MNLDQPLSTKTMNFPPEILRFICELVKTPNFGLINQECLAIWNDYLDVPLVDQKLSSLCISNDFRILNPVVFPHLQARHKYLCAEYGHTQAMKMIAAESSEERLCLLAVAAGKGKQKDILWKILSVYIRSKKVLEAAYYFGMGKNGYNIDKEHTNKNNMGWMVCGAFTNSSSGSLENLIKETKGKFWLWAPTLDLLAKRLDFESMKSLLIEIAAERVRRTFAKGKDFNMAKWYQLIFSMITNSTNKQSLMAFCEEFEFEVEDVYFNVSVSHFAAWTFDASGPYSRFLGYLCPDASYRFSWS